MAKNNTILWVALGVGGYLWWKNSQNQNPTAPAATTAPGLTIPTVPIGTGPAAVVTPVVVPAPQPVSAPATVNQNQVMPSGPIVSPVTVLQPPQATFPVSNAVAPVNTGNMKPLLAPAPVNDALYLQFETGDYPGANPNTVSASVLHASEMM